MRKVRLTESDLTKLVNRILMEQSEQDNSGEQKEQLMSMLRDRFEHFADESDSGCRRIFKGKDKSNYYCKSFMKIFAENMTRFIGNVDSQFDV